MPLPEGLPPLPEGLPPRPCPEYSLEAAWAAAWETREARPPLGYFGGVAAALGVFGAKADGCGGPLLLNRVCTCKPGTSL